MGEHIRQSLGGGQVRRIHRRAEQPEPRFAGRGRGGFEPVVPGAQRHHDAAGTHQRGHVVEVAGEVLDVAIVSGAAQGVRRHRVGARRAADAQVDAARSGRFQQRELLGHRQRRMVGQHHTAGSEPQLRGLRGQVGDQHRRAGGAHGGHVVVFGDPVARETQPVGGLREGHGGRQRVGGGLVGAHRDEIEDGKTHDGLNAVGRANVPGRLGRADAKAPARSACRVLLRLLGVSTVAERDRVDDGLELLLRDRCTARDVVGGQELGALGVPTERPEVVGEGRTVVDPAVVARGFELAGQNVSAQQRDTGALTRQRRAAVRGVAHQCHPADRPVVHHDLRHLVEVEVMRVAHELQQLRAHPAVVGHSPFHLGELGLGVAVVDVQVGVHEAQHGPGLGVAARAVDPGHAVLAVVPLLPVVEVQEVRHGENRGERPQPFDETLLGAEDQRPHVGVQAVGADDEVEAAVGRVFERHIDAGAAVFQGDDGVVKQEFGAVLCCLVKQLDQGRRATTRCRGCR